MFVWLRQWFRPGAQAKRCARCVHFDNRPRQMEKDSPGLSSLSSGYGAVRGGDGQCAKHQRYVSPESTCAEFQEKRRR
jgi:hypothetical protein